MVRSGVSHAARRSNAESKTLVHFIRRAGEDRTELDPSLVIRVHQNKD